jgi:hypothetical protein
MEYDEDYIDKLYSDKFSKRESNISTDDWDKLSAKLGKTNFLKFSFTTFNAYFLSAIISFAAAATYMGVSNVSLSKKIEKLENKIEVLQEQQKINELEPLLPDTTATKEPKINELDETLPDEVVVETKPFNKVKNKTEIVPEKAKVDSIKTKKGSLVTEKPDTAVVKPKKVIKRIKKKVFVKKDKVIIKDTIKIRKHE